jgi:RNA polymerase sigma-70 factor (ECF subfamily)
LTTHAAIDLLAELAPVRDDELAGAAHSPEAQALLSTITAGRSHARPRRRWLAVPALAVLAAAAALAVVSTSGDGTAPAAAATLKRVARVAGQQDQLVPGPGQYVYTKSVDAYLSTTVPAGGAGTEWSVLVPHIRQVWLGPDGGRLYETSGTPRFLSRQDKERWQAAGSPPLTGPPAETALDPAPPLDLPTDPNALYARLQHDAQGHGSGLVMEMFTLIGDSLRETAATPEQRAALYDVAARLPGIQLLGPVHDSAGRPGTGVAMDDHGNDIRSTLIFDPETSALLGEEQVALPGNSFGYPAGERIGYATYLEQAVVNSKTATR